MPNQPSYEAVCTLVGRLYIESTLQVQEINEQARKAVAELRERIHSLESTLKDIQLMESCGPVS